MASTALTITEITDRLMLGESVTIKTPGATVPVIKKLLSQKKYLIEKQLMALGVLALNEKSRLRYRWNEAEETLTISMTPVLSFSVVSPSDD